VKFHAHAVLIHGVEMTKLINLITCFYVDSDFIRHAELRECLERNIKNPLFSRVFVLVEEGSEKEKILQEAKVVAITVPKGRQTYADFAKVANEHCDGQLVVFANTDIHFDETVAFLHSVDTAGKVYVSTRREVGMGGRSLWSYHQQASDAWVVEAPIRVTDLNIQLGKMGCESLFLGRMLRAGYAIENVSFDFKCYHLHMTAKRNYDPNADRYTEECEMAFPVISGRTPSRQAASPQNGPVVVDGVVFAENGAYAPFWQGVFQEWQETPFGREVIVLNRGGMEVCGLTIAQSDAPPLNNYLTSSVRSIQGTLARRLGASVFLSTGDTTALGVPSVVVATSATSEIISGNLDKQVFARGLSYQFADVVLCVGEDVRHELESRYHHLGPTRFFNCPIWHSGSRIFACMPGHERTFARGRLGFREKFVVFAGERINAAKTTNLAVVAEALRHVGGIGIVFIGGPGELEQEVRDLFTGISIRHIAEESEETLLTMAAAEAFLVPHLGSPETDWSHVALASGCPVIRAAWSPIHRDGAGTVFFSTSSISSLVSVLDRVSTQERDRLGLEANARAKLEVRLSNAKRFALFLSALRSGRAMPDIMAILREPDPSTEVFPGILGGGGSGYDHIVCSKVSSKV
jgi:hypothetical protein